MKRVAKMKTELIDKLFDEFEKDKEVIKKNLLLAMDVIHLETEDEYNKIELNIKISRKDD